MILNQYVAPSRSAEDVEFPVLETVNDAPELYTHYAGATFTIGVLFIFSTANFLTQFCRCLR